MPSADKHILQVGRNIRHLAGFYTSHEFNDWTVTVSFYSCVHIVEASVFLRQDIKFLKFEFRLKDTYDLNFQVNKMTVNEGIRNAVKQSNSHELRDLIVQENFPEIADEYHVLWKQSSDARYKCWVFKDYEADFAVKDILLKMIDWFNKEFKQTIGVPAELK